MEENLYSEEVRELVESQRENFEKLGEAIRDFYEELKRMVLEIWEAAKLIYSYPDKRIIHLALYHKKKRVRNKNARIIAKWCIEQRGEQK